MEAPPFSSGSFVDEGEEEERRWKPLKPVAMASVASRRMSREIARRIESEENQKGTHPQRHYQQPWPSFPAIQRQKEVDAISYASSSPPPQSSSSFTNQHESSPATLRSAYPMFPPPPPPPPQPHIPTADAIVLSEMENISSLLKDKRDEISSLEMELDQRELELRDFQWTIEEEAQDLADALLQEASDHLTELYEEYYNRLEEARMTLETMLRQVEEREETRIAELEGELERTQNELKKEKRDHRALQKNFAALRFSFSGTTSSLTATSSASLKPQKKSRDVVATGCSEQTNEASSSSSSSAEMRRSPERSRRGEARSTPMTSSAPPAVERHRSTSSKFGRAEETGKRGWKDRGGKQGEGGLSLTAIKDREGGGG